jgi:hypothetical protein
MNSSCRNQPIHLLRGEGWDETTWSIHEPAVKRATQKADQGMEYLGITFERVKIGRLHNQQIPQGELLSLAGLAIGLTSFNIFTNKIHGEKPRAVRTAASWSSTTVHEVVHCARLERYHSNSLVEVAASEGLAYTAQEVYIGKFCAKQLVHSIPEYDLETPNPVLLERLKDIAETENKESDAAFYLRMKENANKQVNASDEEKWFEEYDASPFVRNGSLIGAQLVRSQVEKGYTLSDLMNLPAGEVLSL